jgi:hypothetical protein
VKGRPRKEKAEKPQKAHDNAKKSKSKKSESPSGQSANGNPQSQSSSEATNQKQGNSQGPGREAKQLKNEFTPEVHAGFKEAGIEAESKNTDNPNEKNKDKQSKDGNISAPKETKPPLSDFQKRVNKEKAMEMDRRGIPDEEIHAETGYLFNREKKTLEYKPFEDERMENRDVKIGAPPIAPPTLLRSIFDNNKKGSSFDFAMATNKRLMAALSTVIEKIGEEDSNTEMIGSEVLSIPLLLKRKITKSPVTDCMAKLEKQKIVIMLDTSGSCYNLAQFYSGILKASHSNRDIDLFEAPNGDIEKEWNGKKWIETNKSWKDFKGRTIIYFGDYDGRNFLFKGSKTNRVFWLYFHRYYTWINDSGIESGIRQSFRGKVIQCQGSSDFIKAVKKIR